MADFGDLEQSIEAQMKAGQVPGLALAAVQDGEIVYAQGLGVASVETGLPVTPDTLFRIGSITKPLTATAIMRLVQAGKLDLDRPVREYVPWLTFSDESAAERITLRLLLSHSAGLPTDHNPIGRRDPEALEAYVRDQIPTYRFIAPPGKLYSYANPGPRLAGYVAQVASGRLYTELMQDLVFDPLEMRRTIFDPTVAMTYPLAQSHDLAGDGALSVRHRFAEDASGYPSGFAISTVLDLAHFALMQMNGGRFGGRQILSPQSVAEMQAAQVDRYTTTDAAYGLGFFLDTYKGLRRVSHSGDISTFGSQLAMIPSAGVAVALLVNRTAGFWSKMDEIVDGLLDRLLGLPPGPPPEPPAVEPERSAWPRYAGSYLGDWCGVATIRAGADRLSLDWNGAIIPLSAYRRDVYFGHKPGSGATVSVGFVPEGKKAARYLMLNSTPCERFKPDRSFRPDPAAWAAYAGRYTGDDTLTIRVQGGRLLVHSENEGLEMPSVTLSNTRFACDVGLLEFQVAADGSVPSLRFGRVYTLSRD
ncbi:MAG: serine hydrolase [Anaerolineae bacterium]|nr:serine hydrolase [Anaerolineae bacterium]